MDEFEQRVKMLETLGVEYHVEQEWRPKEPPREPHPIRVFGSVKLPLRPAEWCGLFMADGPFYIGGCCGSMSHLQDKICHEIRMESGWFSIDTLSEIAEIMINHDGDESNDTPDELTFAHLPVGKSLGDVVAEFKGFLEDEKRSEGFLMDPWVVMSLVWHITKDHYGPQVPSAYGDHVSELDKAVNVVARGLESISWSTLFQDTNHPAPPPESQTKANRSMRLYRLLPALKTLSERISELDLGPVEGFALIEKEKGPEAICVNGHGLCVYETQEAVNEVLDLWRRQDEEYEIQERKPIDGRIGVRRVRVSAEKGIEFLD